MHKVFISYHHAKDQWYKEQLVAMAEKHELFMDRSVDTGDVSDALDDQRIREIIRDHYLRDSTVTIVLVGAETSKRKHVDWEIYSSMFDGPVNKKSGVLVITLPTIGTCRIYAKHGQEEKALYPGVSWGPIGSWDQCKQACPAMPDRLVDNLVKPEALLSVTPWEWVVQSPKRLRDLIELAYLDRGWCKYDLSSPMRRRNS